MKALVLSVGLAWLGLAVAQSAAATTTVAGKLRLDAVSALAARGDAKSLATAAMLLARSAPPQPAALELIAHANELAPQDAAISWLHLQLCIESPACDSRDVATAMRWVDPDNSVAWISILATALLDRDKTEIDRVVADMAAGKRFDLYWNRIVTLLFDTLQDASHVLPPGYIAADSVRYSELTAIAAAHVIPPFGPLQSACKESRARSERHEDCLKLAKIMQRSDTVSAQMAGFNLEKSLVAADGKEWRNITERKNLLEWRVGAAGKLDIPLLPWTANSRIRLRLAEMRLRPREEDVCIALLRDHQKAIEPTENHR